MQEWIIEKSNRKKKHQDPFRTFYYLKSNVQMGATEGYFTYTGLDQNQIASHPLIVKSACQKDGS